MRTVTSAARGSAWTRTTFATLVLVLCHGSCAHPPLQAPEPQGPAHYMIPLDAKNSDWVCAETLPQIPSNYCVTVKAFRIFTMDPKVEP
jgi:hypothetical protein